MKRLFLPLAMLFFGACASAQVPSFKSFNPTQFSTNNFIISITNSALVTNVNNIETLFINSTNIFNLFAPASAGTTSYWTNILGTLQPTAGNIVLVTNLVSEETLKAPGAFVLPSSISSNLVAGANCIDVTYSSSVDFNGPTTTPSDATVELTLGNTQGSILFIHNSGTNAFSMINGTPTCDGTPGAYVRLNGDWAATNRGDGLVLYFTGFIWTEVGRFQGGTNVISGDNVWENVSGNIRPVNGNANNVLSFTSGLADNATNVALVVNTTNLWSASGSTLAQFQNAGTNQLTIGPLGGLTLGSYTLGYVGNPGSVLSAIYSTADGDPNNAAIYFGTLDGGYNEFSWEMSGQTNNVQLAAYVNSTARMRFQPGISSSGSAVAYLFDTSNVLTNGDKLVSIRNAGTEQANISPAGGGILVGPNANAFWGGNADAATLVGAKVTSLGDGEFNQIFVGTSLAASGVDQGQVFSLTQTNRAENSVFVYEANNPFSMQTVVDMTGSGTDAYFQYDADGSVKMKLHPTVTSSGTAVAYTLDTSNVLTNGDKFVSIGNAGTEVLNISPNDTGAQIVWGPGTTNVLYRGTGTDAGNLVYTNGTALGYGFTLLDPSNPANAGRFQIVSGGTVRITSTAASIQLDVTGSANYTYDSSQFHPGTTGINLGAQTAQWEDLFLDNNIVWNGTTNSLFDSWGSATPEGSKTARPGSLFRNTSDVGVVHIKTSGTGNTGWNPAHVGGQAYLSADVTVTNSVAPVTTGLSAKVFNGKRYAFKMVLYIDNATDGEGVRVDFEGGTATMTNFRAQTKIFDTALLTSSQTVALATDITAATVTGLGEVETNGSFEPSGDGTFIPRFAENSAGGAILTVFRGSHLILTEIP